MKHSFLNWYGEHKLVLGHFCVQQAIQNSWVYSMLILWREVGTGSPHSYYFKITHPIFSWSYSLYCLAPMPLSLPQNPTPWTPDLQTSTFYTCPCSLSSVSAQPNGFLHFGSQTDLLLPVDTSLTFSALTLSSLTPSPLSPYSEPLIGPTLFSFLPSVLLVLSGFYFTQLFPSPLSIFRSGSCHLEFRSDSFLLPIFTFPATENRWATHTGGTFSCSEFQCPGPRQSSLESGWNSFSPHELDTRPKQAETTEKLADEILVSTK